MRVFRFAVGMLVDNSVVVLKNIFQFSSDFANLWRGLLEEFVRFPMLSFRMSLRPVEIDRVLLDEKTIQRKVGELAGLIARDYRGKHPLFICVLRGGAIFLADLIRSIDLSLLIDFIAVSSYGSSSESSGEVQLVKDLETSVQGKDLVLVEDIVDTGLTLDYLLRNLGSRRPASLRVCSLLSKPSKREIEVPLDYLGFEIPDCFVVGYGLDYDQKFRNLPFVALIKGCSPEL